MIERQGSTFTVRLAKVAGSKGNAELVELRQRTAELEALETERKEEER